MAKYLITSNTPKDICTFDESNSGLNVMEIFYDTIQGEGFTIGTPAVFLRLQGCTLDCSWCDTEWRKGNRYSSHYLISQFMKMGIVDRLHSGHHLVITGGSPLKQQEHLEYFIDLFKSNFNFKPVIEVENECVLKPSGGFLSIVDYWNNSPKLESSGMKSKVRYKPELIKFMSQLPNSYFKFVVYCEDDWNEIKYFYLKERLIKKEQVILMPLGATPEELAMNRSFVIELAIREGVRYCTREQLVTNLP